MILSHCLLTCLLFFVVVGLEDTTLQYDRMIPDFTKFQYGTNQITFIGFTIDGNIACQDGVDILIFERPNLRKDKSDSDVFKEWSKLNLIENTLGESYNPNQKGDDQYSLDSITNKRIFGANARIEKCKSTQNSACDFDDVLQYLILRGGSISDTTMNLQNSGINMYEALFQLSTQNSDLVPVSIVGGGVRDYQSNKINDINDIDVAISQDYTQIGYRLKDIFVEWNQPIDSSVLDQKGIRKTFGLLKIRPQKFPGYEGFDCSDRVDYTDYPCYGDGLDIGPFKTIGTKDLLPDKYTDKKKLSSEEISNHYFYAYSYDLDKNSRDFTINCIYYDFLGKHFIDPTGLGISDADSKILRIADDLSKCSTTTGCNWNKDLGGWFRFWRFIATRDDPTSPFYAPDGKAFTAQPVGVAEKHVCGNMIKTMCGLLDNGYDSITDYTIYSFFEKLRKKRQFTGNVGVILNSMEALMTDEMYNQNSDNCRNAWQLLTEVANSDYLNTWVHLLQGSSTTSETLEIIRNLAARNNPDIISNDICNATSLANLKRTLRPLQPYVEQKNSKNQITNDQIKNFNCFMREFILSGKSYINSKLVVETDKEYNYEDQLNPLDLDDYVYYNEASFEEEALPTIGNPYPLWTDLEIRSISSINVLYVHKLVLMMVYPRVHSLSENSDLSVYVQSLLDGDVDNLQENTLVLSESFSTLLNEISELYKQSEFDKLFNDLCNWRDRVSNGDEIAVTQWNNIGNSLVVTSNNEQIAISRFFLASFCYIGGIEELSLMSFSKYLLWEILQNREWVLPSTEAVNLFLNDITGNSAGNSTQADILVEQAFTGKSFCSYEYVSPSDSILNVNLSFLLDSSSSKSVFHIPMYLITCMIFVIFILQ